MSASEIYFSYAWNDDNTDREYWVNQLYDSLTKSDYPVFRDKNNMGYRDGIKAFMDRIGKSAFVIVVLSDKYLRSSYCMYELTEIYKNSALNTDTMRKKIFPIVLSDAKIFLDSDREKYAAFWKDNSEFQLWVPPLLKMIADMNIPPVEQLGNNDFSIIKFAIDKAIKKSNERLVPTVLAAIAKYNAQLGKFLEILQQTQDWMKEDGNIKRVQHLILNAFPYSLSELLSQLWGIGELDYKEENAKNKEYIETSLKLAKRTLQLMNFAFLSKLCDYKVKNKEIRLETEHAEMIRLFFDNIIEPTFDQNLKLLKILVSIFSSFPEHAPFSEFEDIKTILHESGDFLTACEHLDRIRKNISVTGYAGFVCMETEYQLATFLSFLGFLSSYKMVSMRYVGYFHTRKAQPYYLHSFTGLGYSREGVAQKEEAVYSYRENPNSTDAIVLFRDNYLDGTNLSPFMINLNSINLDGNTQIFCYSANELDNGLLYCSWYDGRNQNISHVKITDKLNMDRNSLKSLKQLKVLWQFNEAKEIVLGNK